MHLVYLPKFCITILNNLLSGVTVVPREIKDGGYAKFCGVNNMHCGLCENGE